MVSLERTRASAIPKHACSSKGRFELPGLTAPPRAARDREAAPARMSHGDFAAEMIAIIEDRTAMYAGMSRTARDEGFEEIADWFETLAKAGRSHAFRMRRVD